jgi:S1-C subfamily serine protease
MKRPFKSALQLPGIENPERLAGQTTRRNCVHCHNIHDAENLHAQKTGKFTHDMLWRYPLPQNIGLEIDGKSGIRIDKVVKDSPAAKAGIEPGEDVVRINGQPIVSIADMQWVLHHASNEDTQVVVETSKSGRHVVTLALGWKKYDASWRASMWALSPKLRVWTPAVSAEERKKLGINEEDSALLVKWINQDSPGGRSALKSGLREGDIIVEAAGKPIRSTPTQFNMYLKLTYKVGDELPLVVLRNGERRNIRVRLVE